MCSKRRMDGKTPIERYRAERDRSFLLRSVQFPEIRLVLLTFSFVLSVIGVTIDDLFFFSGRYSAGSFFNGLAAGANNFAG